MQKQNKDLLRTLVAGLRHTLLGRYDDAGAFHPGDLDRELERLGIGRDGRITPLDALPYATFHERRAHRVAEAQLVDVTGAQRLVLRQEIVERAAYTWINRLLALRAMEARGLIDEILRPNPAYDGIPEALFILRHTAPQRTSGADAGWWAVIEDACRVQARCLPGLFDLDDPNAALRPSTMALIKCVGLVGGGVDKEIGNHPGGTRRQGAEGNGLDGVFRDPDAIGWAYQFYQEEAKARVYAKLGRGGKVETRGEIAAVTQLFTEPYMVQWLLQNSLGRSYHELYPDSRLPETWAYYIRRPEDQRSEGQKSEGQATDHRSPYTDHRSPFTSLADLTFMDPCMGGGHLEREAFDMLAAMYREQQPEMDATAIADRILSHHLHGIDIDPRAAQLAGLTLYLRAWELVRDERRQRGLAGPGEYRPPRLNLATTPTHLTPGALQRHLQRHPEDRPFEPLLRSVFEALEQAPILGSLLKPGEHLDQALAAYRKPHSGVQMGLLDESASLNRLLEELARHDPDELKRVLLERISRSFAAEAEDADDVGAALFGREAGEGVRLLQLLDRKYAVVATNPPYLGGKNMAPEMRQYIERYYKAGKRDLYSAFILGCVALSRSNGRVAMITQHSWMFLGAFSELRKEVVVRRSVGAIAHLGTRTFLDLSNTNALGFVMFVVQDQRPSPLSTVPCARLVKCETKQKDLLEITRALNGEDNSALSMVYLPRSDLFEKIPDHVLFYWAPRGIIKAILDSNHLSDFVQAKQGLITGKNERFVRLWWEVRDPRWVPYSKGGPYRRWFGNFELVVDWQYDGSRIKDLKTPSGKQKSRPQNLPYYLREGGTWTGQSSYGFSVRYMPEGFIFDAKGPAFFTKRPGNCLFAAIGIANSRVIGFTFNGFQPTVDFGEGYFMSLPGPIRSSWVEEISEPSKTAVYCKQVITAGEPTERTYDHTSAKDSEAFSQTGLRITSFIHTIEGFNETAVCANYELDQNDIAVISSEIGEPCAWHPLIAGCDALPIQPNDLELTPLLQDVLDYLAAHERVHPDPAELTRIKSNLRTLYEAGPGAKTEDVDLEELEHQGDEDEAISGAYIPIPTETFLEELSVKLHIHPISVYWLLEELRAEGVRCKPEERRLLEDRLSVLVLRLLGHRWPRQLEAGEPVPPWADQDGIIPLTPGAGEATVAERLRERLRAEGGPLGAQRVEALLEELTGQTLEVWLRKTFFERHTRQFKRRPIAWQLASTPVSGAKGKGGKKGKREPAFECLLYYHACGGDVLARIRTQYVEPLLIAERRRVDQARKAGDDSAAALATARIHELEDCAGRMRQVEESGFACPALDDLVADEPLDRWSGDGVFPPADRDALLAQERAWRVDINDGVRVNVAPLQVAGLLASDVLNKKDLPKAIADRARWRSDERRWVRAGKLPRCGWMDEGVPESPAWTDLAPEREAERVRLEEKRKAALVQTSEHTI